MCGIVGYVGPKNAVPLLIDGLKRLEYRGYDSAGVAVCGRDGALSICKRVGRLSHLEETLEAEPLVGGLGIGHTRWATHGEPSEVNSHPHPDCTGTLAVVHNGIIENDVALRSALEAKGHVFRSQTDTEVLPHLIEDLLKTEGTTPAEAIREALRQVTGAYALGIVFRAQPDVIYAARCGSPLIIGVGDGEQFIASDVPAIRNRVKQVIYLNDGEVAEVRPSGVTLSTRDGTPVDPQVQPVTLHAEATGRAGFETFMLKEIHEQPRVLRTLLETHVDTSGAVDLGPVGTWIETHAERLQRILIVSCGTAHYAGLYGRLLLERWTGIPCETDLGSEFRYRRPCLPDRTLVVAVSQSGETADTLASVRLAREMGCPILSLCNVAGSTLLRESDAVLLTQAGLEIGVASTKTFTAQLMAFTLLAIHLGRLRGNLDASREKKLTAELAQIPNSIHRVLERQDDIRGISQNYYECYNALYLGRRFNYPIAMEGALKNKEISYQHAEGYAAGEMKHGPIALINEFLPVVCLCTPTADEVYGKMISNLKEVQARKGRIIAVVAESDNSLTSIAQDLIRVPETIEEFSPLINVVALQLFAYYNAKLRGADIDKPRNLAKSVTVE
ncbi:MAG: glutamine--fructose-6-phosphate transaminase (isomerizing) [Kiritimatiellae bacterium]|jgi:glucosamine--fructose-6-phosphate aminotransferase (isomerizing)|nr:glutamine--fructose-6-phosphate transaminase (isomerizing) [Kiritimatiellia bacterium]MDD4341026.1 glutamine--fructose-6-phosphate transaminase (isomerizing) [Kiritimatiellia bacterium]MDY0150240.1 glutamine--fructose-6-phosphate transaminase (isomerizing) [Kiritimatiellia bacterium]